MILDTERNMFKTIKNLNMFLILFSNQFFFLHGVEFNQVHYNWGH
jgi:hypothetical protein